MKTFTPFILLSFLSLLSFEQSHAYDLTKKFGLGAGVGLPIPVWGNQFNDAANPEWGASIHGRYHFDQSMAMELSVAKQGFKKSPFNFENLNLLALYRSAGTANISPVWGLGAGLTRIENYTPHNLKLSLLARAGLEYAISPEVSFGALVDYQYVSKMMGKMPTDPAHVINPQLAMTWYFGGDNQSAPSEEMKKEDMKKEEIKKDVVSTQRSSTVSPEETNADITIQFDFENATIKPQYFEKIKEIAGRLKKSNELTGYIEGHADSVGPEEFNDLLSIKRAEAVRKKLIEYGADSNRLTAEGFGESRPIADNSTAAGRQKNRRAAVYISVRTKLSGVM